MEFLFAPLEGITYSGYRTVHHSLFPGASEYFTPFIAPDSKGSFKTKYLKELTAGVPSVPQLLVNNPDAFNLTALKLHELGFREINLNAGCPSGTVYAKHKGAGMLRDLGSLDRTLEAVYEQAERTRYRISIKTRMGDHSTGEFPAILEVFRRYPVSRLIVHARCRDDYYKGETDLHGFREAAEKCFCPLVYNGGIASALDLQRLLSVTEVNAVMIGRGAVGNPAIFRELQGGTRLTAEELQVFLDCLTEEWLRSGLSPDFTLERMKTLWPYMKDLFPNEGKRIRSILKAGKLEVYRAEVSALLREYPGTLPSKA